MNQTKIRTSGSPALRNIAILAAVATIAIVVSGEYNTSLSWAMLACGLPLLVLIIGKQVRRDFIIWRRERDAHFTLHYRESRAIVRGYQTLTVLSTIGFIAAVAGTWIFFIRGNAWLIAGLTAVSLVCLEFRQKSNNV